MVVQAAGQDPGGIGDVAHRRRPHAALGEHARRQGEQLRAAVGAVARRWAPHGCWLLTEMTSPVR